MSASNFFRLKQLFRRAAQGEELTILPTDTPDATEFYLMSLIVSK